MTLLSQLLVVIILPNVPHLEQTFTMKKVSQHTIARARNNVQLLKMFNFS
jgi:hypothetical protein